MDSLTRECCITRTSLLSQLDGIATRKGILTIGTTNNASEIDPALVHRPSRFDRVWHFPLPDRLLRLRYLELAFAGLPKEFLGTVARETEGWSFAYLNELRTTTAILCINRTLPAITGEALEDAFDLLSAQFRAGRNNHASSEPALTAGFMAV